MNIIAHPEFNQSARDYHDARSAALRDAERLFANHNPQSVLTDHRIRQVTGRDRATHAVQMPQGEIEFYVKNDEAHLVGFTMR